MAKVQLVYFTGRKITLPVGSVESPIKVIDEDRKTFKIKLGDSKNLFSKLIRDKNRMYKSGWEFPLRIVLISEVSKLQVVFKRSKVTKEQRLLVKFWTSIPYDVDTVGQVDYLRRHSIEYMKDWRLWVEF